MTVVTTATAKILLVEDDSLLRHAFRLLLEDAGYLIREAGTAQDAVRHAHEEIPDVVLLDLGLPDAPGLDVARQLRAEEGTSSIAIIALTGRVGSEERAACLAAGCNAYLAKPVDPKELLRTLTQVLRPET